MIAGGHGGFGAYRLSVSTPVTAPACAPKPLGTIPSTSPLTRTGQLFGDYAKGCGAPLPIPGISDDVPDISAAADIYTFTAVEGDVISISMDSDYEPHVFLYGPASAGNPRVAQSDYTQPGTAGAAELVATLALAGTYTIVAANNNALFPPDPRDPTDPGDIVDYSLSIRKCPRTGGISPGTPLTRQFSSLDCTGFGGIPYRSYVFAGTAGDFVSVSMTSSDVDAAVRLLGPDGSQVYNDDDLFVLGSTDARVNRILPASGLYIVEVSTSLNDGAVDLTPPLPSFKIQVQKCATTPVAAQQPMTGTFQAADCELTPGRKYDVYTFAGPAATQPQAVSLLASNNACVVGLYAEGLQTPNEGCSSGVVEMPVVTSGTYGFVVAANDETVRGVYAAEVRRCPLTTVGFGESGSGSLSSGGCAVAGGGVAGWHLLRGAADLVNFNGGFFGVVTPGFHGTVTDSAGSFTFGEAFGDDSSAMLPLGRDLAALIRVEGPTSGSYTLSIDPASLRQ